MPSPEPVEAAALARKAHRTLEPLHIVAYFAPEPGERYAELGVTGMRGYFASRSAAMGAVTAEVVIATFFNFHPDRVRKAIPSVWDATTPEAITAARYDGVDAAYRRVLGEATVESEQMAEAAELAREACSVLDPVGRPLFAGHASLPWPQPAHLQLFHAQTLLREHRGDGHVAALMLAGLDACEALVSYAPLGTGMPKDLVLATRGWSEADWDAAHHRLVERGLLDESGGYTEAGKAQRDQIEHQTDTAAAAPYLHLGPERTERLRNLARPWSKAFSASMFGGGS